MLLLDPRLLWLVLRCSLLVGARLLYKGAPVVVLLCKVGKDVRPVVLFLLLVAQATVRLVALFI